MDQGIDTTVVVLGLPGFRLLELTEEAPEIVATVETTADRAWCEACGVRAKAKDRAPVAVRHLPACGRPVQLRWCKRVWECPEERCATNTWRETSPLVRPRHVLTEPARWEATRRVGELAHTPAEVARSFGVSWHTIMRATEEHGRPLVEGRPLRGIRAFGLDETLFTSARPGRRAAWCTGFCDLDRHRLIDVVRDRSGVAVERWLAARPEGWKERVRVVALDPHGGYAKAVRKHMGHARLVLDPFHAVALANRAIDDVRRRVQQEVHGHRGRKGDPLYGIRRLLLRGRERLTARGEERIAAALDRFDGDPFDEVRSAWWAKELLRAVYAAPDREEATERLEEFFGWADDVDVAEVSRLARTISRWERELLNHFDTRASNGPTEALNALVKKVKRIGHGFRNFENYRLRVLLHCGGVAWDTPSTVKLRSRRPRLVA